jgi:hypothetical protein
MNEVVRMQGRDWKPEDIERICGLIAKNPAWSRRRLSEALAAEWNWRNGAGRLKDMAARTLLVKLEARGMVQLPPRRQTPSNRMTGRRITDFDGDQTPVTGTFGSAGPLQVSEVSSDLVMREHCRAALERFHYLGCRGAVGENLHYAVTNTAGRLLACVLFGAAAWKCRSRDEFIGWSAIQKQERLGGIVNNSRFLILPFVRIPHLASWILGKILRRLGRDWEAKYGHPVVLVETFVDRERFRGTCYRAANWIHTGTTTGRSRQDRRHILQVPVKDVYVYPLRRRFRQELAV